MRVLGVIPARYGSTRLPAKALAEIHGKPMVQWVYEGAAHARSLTEGVVVATDDERIASVVRGFGGKAVMTSPDLASGTDRVAAVADQIKADAYVNIQGDEPLISARGIDPTVALVTSGRFTMASVMTPLRRQDELQAPQVVKVLVDSSGRALYFSRYPIPYSRGEAPADGTPCISRKHVGLYVYTRDVLFKIRELPRSPIEIGESLEQLRAMEAGIAIGMTEVDFESIGVDTAEDLEKVRQYLRQSRQG